MLVCPVDWGLPPVTAPIGVLTGFIQVYKVPAGIILPGVALDGITVKEVSLQIVAVSFCTNGFGFTVTVTVNAAPTQLPPAPDVGITVYVAVCARLPGLINVPLILV